MVSRVVYVGHCCGYYGCGVARACIKGGEGIFTLLSHINSSFPVSANNANSAIGANVNANVL